MQYGHHEGRGCWLTLSPAVQITTLFSSTEMPDALLSYLLCPSTLYTTFTFIISLDSTSLSLERSLSSCYYNFLRGELEEVRTCQLLWSYQLTLLFYVFEQAYHVGSICSFIVLTPWTSLSKVREKNNAMQARRGRSNLHHLVPNCLPLNRKKKSKLFLCLCCSPFIM